MNFELLLNNVQKVHQTTQQSAVKAVNISLTVRNWLIGYYIVAFEQNGADRAQYGTKLISELAKQVNIKGLGETNLKQSRKFFLTYPQISQTVSDLFNTKIRQSITDESFSDELIKSKVISQTPSDLLLESNVSLLFDATDEENNYFSTILNKISFSHFIELLKIDIPAKRKFYELIIIKTQSNVEELKHQIATLSFERLVLSNNQEIALQELESKIIPAHPTDAVKSIYFFDFLQLPNNHLIQESDLEQALINHLQEFIIELGNGFCFEARQKRILIDEDYYFADLVFYHRILKCHIIIELKVDQFKHEHLSQLNTYVSYFREEVKQVDDNPPIGILLCTEKGDKLVEYALSGLDEKLFVSKYLLQLPSKEVLQNFIENEIKKLAK
jgi:predicted nuclease of restriction endonuclease-like (RecB) superfamily